MMVLKQHFAICSCIGIELLIEMDCKTKSAECINRKIYRQVSNIRRILVGNQMVDHSDVVGASPVGAAPTTSAFST